MRNKWSEAVSAAGLDAIIHPAVPMPAPRHGMVAQIALASYLFLSPMLLWYVFDPHCLGYVCGLNLRCLLRNILTQTDYVYTYIHTYRPTGVLPVTTVHEDEQHYYDTKETMEQLPKNQRDHMAKLIAGEMKGSVGLPINISVLTPNFEDEKCLRVMKEIEQLIKFDAVPNAYKE